MDAPNNDDAVAAVIDCEDWKEGRPTNADDVAGLASEGCTSSVDRRSAGRSDDRSEEFILQLCVV